METQIETGFERMRTDIGHVGSLVQSSTVLLQQGLGLGEIGQNRAKKYVLVRAQRFEGAAALQIASDANESDFVEILENTNH